MPVRPAGSRPVVPSRLSGGERKHS
jgi:hypothetical protein